MACKRNRIIDLIEYIESCGVQVNIGKNKAQGNRGFFKVKGEAYRIDIAKNQSEESVLKTLAHEFAHFVHYKNDKTLKSLDFAFDLTDEVMEELISITVESIPKSMVKPLFEKREHIKQEHRELLSRLKDIYPDFKESSNYTKLEQKIKRTSLKYLLKYDRVKVFEGFSFKIYSVDNLDLNSIEGVYIKFKSLKRMLNRINSKINRLNKYYNSPTELFARSFEEYVSDKIALKQLAPNVYNLYEELLNNERVPLINNFVNKLK